MQISDIKYLVRKMNDEIKEEPAWQNESSGRGVSWWQRKTWECVQAIGSLIIINSNLETQLAASQKDADKLREEVSALELDKNCALLDVRTMTNCADFLNETLKKILTSSDLKYAKDLAREALETESDEDDCTTFKPEPTLEEIGIWNNQEFIYGKFDDGEWHVETKKGDVVVECSNEQVAKLCCNALNKAAKI